MGILDILGKSDPAEPMRLPSGSFSVDREGHILSSTLPRTFPDDARDEIARQVLLAFRGGSESGLAFSELVIRYSGFKITARELRGGALIFLSPQTHISA